MLRFINVKKCLALLTMCISISVNAQDDTANPQDKNDELAKELSNPNATLGTMALQLDYIHYHGNLPNANQQNGVILNFQPSLPIPLGEDLNLFVRPMIPIYLSQPVFGADGFEKKGFNLGNISADVAIGKTWPSKFISILGIFGGFSTATDKALKSNFTTLGPEIMFAQLYDWGVLGLMVNHAWSVNSKEDKANSFTVLPDDMWITTAGRHTASVTSGQYFYVVNLKNAWQITGQPTWAYNHKAEKGNKLTFPIATGVNKVMHLGKLPVKLSLQYWYYVASPDDFGPRHQVRLQIAPVIKLPW